MGRTTVQRLPKGMAVLEELDAAECMELAQTTSSA
jgi:hypothetical protein